MSDNTLQTINIESQDVIRLMLQFLKENGLTESMQCLQKESGVAMNIVEDVQTFISNIRYGRWDAVLTQVANLTLPLEKLVTLYEQIFYELLEAGERDLAKEILRQTDPLQTLKHSHPERYARLEALARRPYFAASDVYETGQSRDSRRHELSLSLAAEVGTVDPSRLL
eukprot:gene11865-14505_t